jgi:hypothetical protein
MLVFFFLPILFMQSMFFTFLNLLFHLELLFHIIIIFLLAALGFASGPHPCKAGTLPLEPFHQPCFVWVFSRQGLTKYLPGLASEYDPS